MTFLFVLLLLSSIIILETRKKEELMKNKNHRHIYLTFIVLFFFLNIVNTFFLTIQELNRYIAPFRHTVLGEMNAFVGNFSVLFLIIVILFSIFKTAKSRMKALIFTSLALNFLIYLLGIFNLYFGTAFSMPARTIFYNPAGGFALGTLIEVLLELILYWRIVVFLPTIVLTVIYFLSNRNILKRMRFQFKIKHMVVSILAIALSLFVSATNYTRLFYRNLPLNSVKSTFAIQNYGVYPYYLGQFIGWQFDMELEELLEIKNDADLAEAFQYYNRNQSSYVSYFDGQTYSNRLTTSQAVDNLFVDSSLTQDDQLHGIFEGKNLVLVQVESLNQFLLQVPEVREKFVFLNNLFEQSFVLNEFYNNVGMGVSSDAEFSVLTGLYPKGEETIYWEYNNTPYELNTLVKYFNQQNYFTQAIHGDVETFYNRNRVYDLMLGFDDYYSIEDFIADGYDTSQGFIYNQTQELFHLSPWVSDYYLADKTIEHAQASTQPFLLFPITMMPHTPFDFNPLGMRTDLYSQELVEQLTTLTLKYINYASYYDETLKRFFFDEYNNNKVLEDTVYIFYSDHGSGIKNGDLDILFGEALPVTQVRRILQQGVAFIYAPGDEMVSYGNYQLNKGLLTGEQNLVRSQVDMYRTIVELFNLPVGQDSYFGAHLLSQEKTFALDNRLMDVILDGYMYSMRNRTNTFPIEYEVDPEVFEYILRFKQLSDLLLSKKDYQERINQAILTYGGA